MKKSIFCKLVILVFLINGAVAWSTELVQNGDFEDSSNGWTEWSNSELVPSWVLNDFGHDYASGCDVWNPVPYPFADQGTHCQHVGTAKAHGGIYQVLDVAEGRKYKISGHWSGGGGGLVNDEPGVPTSYSSWYEVTIFHGAVGTLQIDQGIGPFDVIAKKEFSGNGSENFYFAWEIFNGTFTAQSDHVTLAIKTGQYGNSYDAIAAYHDNISVKELQFWPMFMPAVISNKHQ